MRYLIFIAFISLAGLCAAQSQQLQPQNTIAIHANDSKQRIIEKAAHVVPTANQLAALKNEFIAFVHFGPNTFTRLEWGSGREDPRIFDLKELNTDQWCEAMKAAGMKMVILTVKHHDGFVIWQSRYTRHGIMSTGFREGKGDILKDLSASCKKYGLQLGIYLSPADLYQIENPEGLYGNLSKYTKRTIPREIPGRPFANKTRFEFVVDDYNEYFLNQLFELLTEYGPVHEVWFDGAHPKTKGGQQYNYQAWKKLIHTLAPGAVIFGKEDIRWCGNEAGGTRQTEWNVVPYADNPDTTSRFPDMTNEDIGSREQLYKAKYLHYQQAETNTSIREGWFYRDDEYQKVRSADDVFDIYERSVGGNSTFLLNIPPDREGKFPSQDVSVLTEVGKRIRETYSHNLFAGASVDKSLLDDDLGTFVLLGKKGKEIIITLSAPVTINRFLIQESVGTHSERVERHAVEAWINDQWKEIASATNIGYKRILRFPEVTASKFRLRILESRLDPAIATISAYAYKTRPPRLQVSRNRDGQVAVHPLQAAFNWKPHGENTTENLYKEMDIFYTTDGSEPTVHSKKYTGPFELSKGEVKAVAVIHNEKGATAAKVLGIAKNNWKVVKFDSESARRKAAFAIDENAHTWWQSGEAASGHFITVDLGKTYALNAFAYTPQQQNSRGMMAGGNIEISMDGETWSIVGRFKFGNLVNDPSKRTYFFDRVVTARYIRITATEIAGGDNTLAIAELDFYEP
ncbi:MAG: alpha-L-fucosidase [Chitinophagaceae bacterium]|nr:alpha-L-fucosidase [Chitinophagaceae bacterium]MCW5929064.1 alpha-L-fucosidase [Chitinophagaceae bacterium]